MRLWVDLVHPVVIGAGLFGVGFLFAFERFQRLGVGVARHIRLVPTRECPHAFPFGSVGSLPASVRRPVTR